MKKIWFLLFVLATGACAPAAVSQPAVMPTILPTVTSQPTEEVVVIEPDTDCSDPEHMFLGAKCMATDEKGEYLNPAVTTGCLVNGQQIGSPSPNAWVDNMQYVQCDLPLYEEAYAFEDTQYIGATTRFGFGSERGVDPETNFPTEIWFMRDGTGILQNVKVNIIGCYPDATGYSQTTLPQYEKSGFPTVDATGINSRVFVELDGWYTWGWTGSFDGTADGTMDHSTFEVVCPTYPSFSQGES